MERGKNIRNKGVVYLVVLNKSINKIIKRGELNGYSILTELDVLSIRNEFKPRVFTRKDLAQKYGVSENCIKDVIIRKSWKHI